MKCRFSYLTLIALMSSLILVGCATSSSSPPATESNLTPGMAKKTIVKNQTTQAEVLEVFGPPDLVTHKGDMQVWTYDKVSHDITTSGGYFTVLIAGASSKSQKSSSTSTMLIIYFDKNDIVQDYRMHRIRF